MRWPEKPHRALPENFPKLGETKTFNGAGIEMAGFLKRVFSGDDAKTKAAKPVAASPDAANLKVDKLVEVIRYFPLGEKIQYYPEYQQGSALDTLVLGYAVNKHHVFSPINIRHQNDGERDVFRLLVDGQEQLIRHVDAFRILIPNNPDDDNKRDYTRRAELGPRGAFRRRNTITLLSSTQGGTLSSVDTSVYKVQSLEHGIYSGHEVVLLDVLPGTLKLTDQRQHYRLTTRMPARLAVKDGGDYPCTLLDFSEESVQLQFERSNSDLETLTPYRRLTLSIDASIDATPKIYVLEGVMYRKTANALVMKLQGIRKDKESRSLNLVDILDIKANLLRHPKTQQALEEENQAR